LLDFRRFFFAVYDLLIRDPWTEDRGDPHICQSPVIAGRDDRADDDDTGTLEVLSTKRRVKVAADVRNPSYIRFTNTVKVEVLLELFSDLIGDFFAMKAI